VSRGQREATGRDRKDEAGVGLNRGLIRLGSDGGRDREKRHQAPGAGSAHSRDRELVRFVGHHGVVAMRHVMAELGVGRTAAYRRVAACVERGLLERLELLRSEPGLLRATRDGLRYAGLGLPVAVITPGAVDHRLRCASTAQLLGRHFGQGLILTERELVLAEQIEGRPIASAKVGKLPNGAPALTEQTSQFSPSPA
jgi:hypothetical protein